MHGTISMRSRENIFVALSYGFLIAFVMLLEEEKVNT